ncbi:MAG: hypothetical protein ACK2UO_12400 [Caldilineaceae bacterium]
MDLTTITADPPPSGQLAGKVVRPADLTDAQLARMSALLEQFFENTSPEQLVEDLNEKEWVVLLYDSGSEEVEGFSTLMRIRLEVDGQPVTAFYSGDTIIHPDYWNESALPRIWSKHVFALAEAVDEDAYWFLISSGYKTYRFLPVFFHEFYPSCLAPMPPHIKNILDALGQAKFPGEYDPTTGVIRFGDAAPLRDGVAEVTPRRLKDPHVAFFVRANPGYAEGEQLACLVKLTRGNLNSAGLRMLESE